MRRMEEEDDYHDEEDEDDTHEYDDHHGNQTSHDDGGTPKDDITSQNDKYFTHQYTVYVHNLDDYLNQHKQDVDAILKRFL
jgi:hypothetical protein